MNIGDRIKIIAEGGIDVTVGKTYPVIQTSDSGSFAITDDRGDENWAIYYKEYLWCKAIKDDELEELRAFKAAALARFPALAEPETDEEAADRLESEHYDQYRDMSETIAQAFAWARANPR